MSGDDEKDRLIKKLQDELAKTKAAANDLVKQVKIPTSKHLQRIMTRGLKKYHTELHKALGKSGRRIFDGFAYRLYMEYRVSRANGDDPHAGELFSGDFCLDGMDHRHEDYNDNMFREFVN